MIVPHMRIYFYKNPSGRSPVTAELDSLPVQAAAHAYELLEGIEEHGLNAPRIVFRQIEGKLWEIKMNLPSTGGYRVFYSLMARDAILLLHAYSKKSQKAPIKELNLAKKRLYDALERGL
jgi:phage-related protein